MGAELSNLGRYNLRWLLCAITRNGIGPVPFLACFKWC
jgi:hypothetical protein